MAFSIDDFSNYFCLVFSAPLTVPHELDLGRSQLGVEPETLSEVISNLHKVSWEEFHPAIEQLMNAEKSNACSFMEKVLAKCTIISGVNPTYANFILVCTFINGIVYDSFEYSDCFIVPKLCSCVLVSIYHRCYKDYFDSKEEGDTLDFHIRALKKHLPMQKDKKDRREIPVLGEIYATSILEDLVYDEGIPLEDSEHRMFIDMHSITPVDICDQPFRHLSRIVLSQYECSIEDASENEATHENYMESTSNPFESESSSCLDFGIGETMVGEPMYEESTNKSSAIGNIYTDETECVSMSGDFSGLTSRSFSKPKPSSPDRDSNKEDENKLLKKEYSSFKNKICDLCGGECAKFMVSYVENILEKFGK